MVIAETPKHFLTSRPSYKVPHATVRGHRAPRRMGPFCFAAYCSQQAVTVTHPPWNRSCSFRPPLHQRVQSHLQSSAFRHQTCLEIAPERNQQLACDSDDRNPPDAALEFANTIAEPDTQGAVRLMSQPHPRELNHGRASLGVTSLADTLITAHRAALKMRRRQTDIAPQLFAIVKRAVEHFADKCGRKFGPDALDFDQILDLLCARMLRLSLADATASRSASIVLIIPMTSSSRCSSRRISVLSRGGNA